MPLSDKPDPVVLHSAYSWECPACGLHQHGDMVTAESTDEECERAIRASLGLEDWQEVPEGMGGEFVCMPTRVACASCGRTFPVFGEE